MFVACVPPALGGRPRPRDPLRRASPRASSSRGTRIGAAAAEAYGAAGGESAEAYMARRFPAALDPDGVARAILQVAGGEEHGDATLLTLTAAGIDGAVTGQ